MLPAHQLQGELAIPVHTYMQSCPHTHAPGGANIRASSCPKVPCAVIAVAIVVPFLPGFATLGRQRSPQHARTVALHPHQYHGDV